MNLEGLIQRFWIEDGNQKNDGKGPVMSGAKANIVEHGKNSKNTKKDKQKLGPKGGVMLQLWQEWPQVIWLQGSKKED